jgi:SNF2 family DNA or RNA helicase
MHKNMWERMTGYFSSTVLTQGENDYNAGLVLSSKLSDGLLRARVKSNSKAIYDVHFDLKTWPKTPTYCTCQKSACEHAVASLIFLQKGQPKQIISDFSASIEYLPNSAEIFNADDLVWYSDTQKSENDFFAYQMGIVIDEHEINIVPLVVELLGTLDRSNLNSYSDDKIFYLPIQKNKKLRITFARIKPLLQFLIQYTNEVTLDNGDIKLRKYQLLLLEEAERAIKSITSRWEGTEILRQRLKQLTELTSLPIVDVPSGLRTQLRDYQHQGLNWLQCLRENQFSGVLADDMGLGKTIQALAHLQYEKEQGRLNKASLIIAPTSLVMNWFEEAQKFTPELSVLIFHGTDRHQDKFDNYDLVISTYGLIQRDKKRFTEYGFYYLILDEAQFIKNSRTKTTLIIQQLEAKHRLCLTGTPLENHLGELWSLFHFLMPGLLGDARQFRQCFRIPIEKNLDQEKQALLSGRVQPFMLRRTKNQVAQELPDKTEITHMIQLQGAQRDLYESIRMLMENKVRDVISRQGRGRSHIILLDALLRLRQVCCDPRLLTLSEAKMAHGVSAKLDALVELLDNLMLEGRRVLVFSQFTSMLLLIEERLRERNYAYLKLTGKTKNRQELVHEFQNGQVPIFLISLKAGGTGLNLTGADTVILYDPWWNPAVQDQATDRSHRIGQKKPVFVYKLITSGTVEEVILKIQEQKRSLVQGVFSQATSGDLLLTEMDLEQFFMPLN